MDQRLLQRMQELKDLAGVIGLATWDQETYLPRKAEGARASQLATLQGLYHERLVEPALGDWLQSARGLPLDEQAMVRVLTEERDRAVKVPARLVKELAEAQSLAIAAWKEAREKNAFERFRPHLERLLALRREQADAIGHGGERYDALLDNYEPGMKVERLTPVLQQLRQKLTPIVEAICAAPPPPDVFQGQRFAPDAQWTFTLELLGKMGFDLDAGRQDKSVHPFTGGTHPRDVRLTTRIQESTPLPAIYGAIHEGGHGLYEQGFAEGHFRTPIAAAPSMGLHESQSRLWENVVGRSLAFWQQLFPRLQQLFPDALGKVSLHDWHRAVNRVERSFIRVEADEVTYNLHVVLRYELELELLRGNLPVAELPGAWNAKMQSMLGVSPPNATLGVLQDIHWAWGEFGYFPTYALGNLYAASLFGAACREVPGLEAAISRGELAPLRDWLRERVHGEGFRYYAEDLVKKVTGKGLTDEDFITYLRTKYSALYGVKL
ncbi:MAG: carboxypeptidase M32 [Archangiaceae bacterium]|nr:carboxypeptidase M32 [Archangiaceae bacterium]